MVAIVDPLAHASGADAVRPCSSAEVSLGLTAALSHSKVVITLSLHHFRGAGACRIEAPVAVSLLTDTAKSTLLQVRGNPTRSSLEATLAARATATTTFTWSNWCRTSGTYAVNGVGPFGGGIVVHTHAPVCTAKVRPSSLARG